MTARPAAQVALERPVERRLAERRRMVERIMIVGPGARPSWRTPAA
jgi:hypothetical protein